MFERNFAKSQINDKNAQEALAATNQRKETLATTTTRKDTGLDCRKWISDGRPTKRESCKLIAPYTPEQNNGSEREMCTIIEMVTTFKYSNPDVNYPAAMWVELVTTAVYVLRTEWASRQKKVLAHMNYG
ncbi:hypothetical protein AVEN_216552-1 [Araneus ventricosus]|uniref:Integrase catalytic domain-containing protein n=1 Tax=Araneus ventricosus TaxID=182803 RepID=A0A4Y2EUF7_ARAVE|nr:hypothetical protein AVEN_216552-1 [Araneus ventricosus]